MIGTTLKTNPQVRRKTSGNGCWPFHAEQQFVSVFPSPKAPQPVVVIELILIERCRGKKAFCGGLWIPGRAFNGIPFVSIEFYLQKTPMCKGKADDYSSDNRRLAFHHRFFAG